MLVAGLGGGCLGALSVWADAGLPYGVQMALDAACWCLPYTVACCPFCLNAFACYLNSPCVLCYSNAFACCLNAFKHLRYSNAPSRSRSVLCIARIARIASLHARVHAPPIHKRSRTHSHWRCVLRKARRSCSVVGIVEGELILNCESREDRAVEVLYEGELVSCLYALVASCHLFAPLQQAQEQEQEGTWLQDSRVLHPRPFILTPPLKVFGSMPSVVTWHAARCGAFCITAIVPSQWQCLAAVEAAQEWSTEYSARYRSPDVLQTMAARRGKHNKDAAWRATIDTDNFKHKPPPPGAANGSDSDSSSCCFVPEPFVFPGPGAYETEEGLRLMRDRQRVPPGFGIGRRFSWRWSLPFPLLNLASGSRLHLAVN